MQLYMTELPVRDVRASMAWYRDRLGLSLVLFDDVNEFALLEATGRIALKQSADVVCGATLHFQVPSLDVLMQHLTEHGIVVESSPKSSEEGYRRIFVRDPDGHRVGFFEWQK